MGDIEILNRIRELRDRCEDLHVRLRVESGYKPVAAGPVKDAWQALGLAVLDFRIAVEKLSKEVFEPCASGTGVPPDESSTNAKKPSEKSGENNG